MTTVLLALFSVACGSATRSAPASMVSVSGPVEYTTEAVDAFDYLTYTDDKATITVEGSIDASQVGEQAITIEVKRGLFSRTEEDVYLTVKDSVAPTIKLRSSKVTLAFGEELDPSDNVALVSDPVDGTFEEVSEVPVAQGSNPGLERFYDEGWYVVEGACDFEQPGTYPITVTASDKHGNTAQKSFTIKVRSPFAGVHLNKTTKVLEYAREQIDPVKLVTCSDPAVRVTADPVDLSTTGKKQVTYTLEKSGFTKTLTRTFRVRDTKKPKISLASESVSVDFGASFDPFGNVVSVSDPVDGALARSDGQPASNGDGWYTVEGSYDADAAGAYFFTVVACDRNGNRAQKEFRLQVKEPPVVVDNARDYIINTNTGKFHYPSCSDVKRMKESNKWYVHMDRNEIVNMGYSPCQHCWP